MRKKTVIFMLSFVFVFMMADTRLPFMNAVLGELDAADEPDTTLSTKAEKTVADSLQRWIADSTQSQDVDTTFALHPDSDFLSPSRTTATGEDDGLDSLGLDSLQLAVYKHNKAIDDSIRLDSLNKKKKTGIDAPVTYSANDSLVYKANTKTAYLYGDSKVDYMSMNLNSDRIYMSLDSNLVHATGSYADTTMTEIKGKPVFKMGNDTYENDTMAFNFKTKKGLISNAYTQQEDGFLWSKRSKRDSSGVMYLQHGKYTTCDAEHPDFYISLSRAKVRPGKDVIFGPAYLVVCDVPLPLAIPYGFFPFTKSYSSGFIMPTYGDESIRGFYLRDGGYYFAINDKWDLKLLGEIYTKGSWGISAASNYTKRYRYSGSFYMNYQKTKHGDKGMPDYGEDTSFKLQWSHNQDAKANPFSSLTASVNFTTSNFETNNLTSLYNPQARSQSQRNSSVNWKTSFSSIGLSLSVNSNLNQNMRDTSINLSLPDLNVMVTRFYPFKRKNAAGEQKWYEKISFSYTGRLQNSIETKESKFLKSNLIKDWRNGMHHSVPVEANFMVMKYINVSPRLQLTDRMYTNKVIKSWDVQKQRELNDTVYGFYNIFDWNLGLSANTTVYGMWTPSRKLFGDKIQAIRHVMKPTISFSFAPDFSTARYGYYDTYQKTDADGNVTLEKYYLYSNGIYDQPRNARTGSIGLTLSNNIEMKVKSDDDSTGYKKISIIDELGLSMSYNMAAKEKPWSDLQTNIRLKWWKNYTFNMNATFATYAYELDENGRPYIGNRTEYSYGRFGRFTGTSQNISINLDPEKLKKLFGKKSDEEEKSSEKNDDYDTGLETNIDDDMEKAKRGARKESAGKAETDADGYLKFSMPWSLSIGYTISMRENTSGKFNTKRMRYPYSFSQTLNVSGNVRLSDGWNINFSSGYDFDTKKISMTRASLQRDLHCFSMSCDVVIAPYTSYNFSFRCNASTLTDALKYDKRSGYGNAVQWY